MAYNLSTTAVKVPAGRSTAPPMLFVNMQLTVFVALTLAVSRHPAVAIDVKPATAASPTAAPATVTSCDTFAPLARLAGFQLKVPDKIVGIFTLPT